MIFWMTENASLVEQMFGRDETVYSYGFDGIIKD